MKQKSVKRKGCAWKWLLAVVLAAVVLPFASVQQAQAAEEETVTETKEVSIQVTFGQTQARELAKQINEKRAKADPALEALAYDYGLEQAAMQRATEIALVYDAQTRPNGTKAETLYQSYTKAAVTETISCAGATAALVYSELMADVTADSYQNVMDADAKAIGVGHVSYQGKHYWVIAAADQKSTTGVLPADNGTAALAVELETSRISNPRITGVPTGTLTMYLGEYYDLSKCQAQIQVKGHYPATEYCPLAGELGVVSDTSVVSFNKVSLYAAGTGESDVAITCGGFVATSFKVTVKQPRIDQATIDAIADQSYTGYALRPAVKVRLGDKVLTENKDYTLQYSNNTNMGTAIVTVSGNGTYFNTGSKVAYFRIVAPSVANATISPIPDQTYTGNAICPGFTVLADGTLLQEGTDYTVSYTNNVNIGTATVLIVGIGRYTGTRTEIFRITGPNLYGATIQTIPDQLYKGSEIRPAITVTLGNVTLRDNTDYYVSYSNNRNVGTATVTVTGRNNYSGTKTTTFRILGKDMSNTTVSSISTQRYTGKAVCPGVTVKIGSVTLRQDVDYTLTYQDNRRPGTASIVIKGAGSYSGSKTVTFKIAQASLSSATVKVSDQTYNGKEKTPNVTVKLGGETLSEDEDYELEYRNNKKPGKATVVITGLGDYSGTKKATFVIRPKKITWRSIRAKAGAASMSWKKDRYASGYELYRSRNKSSGYSRIGTLKKNTYTACTNHNLSSGTYYYKVRSYIVVDGEKQYGAFSNVKSVKIK